MFGGYSLERRYGITKAERDAMFEAQDGKCVICGGEGGSRGLVVDHDHETMQVRDLLCNRCNVAVGVIESKLFEVFLEYIAYHKGGELTIGETQT
jgi:5-methylcytosine-specific restriction endonuclease McrA